MPSPARIRWAKIRSIALSVTALFILGTLLYLLGGDTLFQQKAPLYLYIPDATGLAAGSPVRVNGIGVGKVEHVALSGDSRPSRVVQVGMLVGRENLARIPDDSTAQLSNDTVVGDKYVDIEGGKSPGRLRPGAELTYKEQVDMLKSIDLEQFEQQLRLMDALLTDIEEGKSRVSQFVLGDQMYQDLVARVTDLDKSLRAAVAKTGQLGQAVYTQTLYRRIQEPLAEFDRSLALLQSGQGPAGRFLRSDEQYESFLATVRDLKKGLADFRAGELVSTDRMYTEWDQQVASLIRQVDEVNAGTLFASPITYENFTGLARELGTTVKTLREDPRKYLRLKIF